MELTQLVGILQEAGDAAFKKGDALPVASFERHEWHLIALDLTRAVVRIDRILAQEKKSHGE